MRPEGSLQRQVVVSALVLGIVVALGACTGGDGDDATGSGSAPDASAIASARQRIEGSDLTDPASLSAIDEIRFSAEGAAAAREALTRGATGDELWAAVWVYGTSGEDPTPLLPLLDDGDVSVRVMAAAAVVARGELAGFEVLVAELENAEPLSGSEPPQTVWEFALTTLERYTGEPPVLLSEQPTNEELVAAHDAWSAWFQEHRAALSFDEDAGTWSVV